MKNGKKPTLAQKKFLQDTGLDSEKWLIVKDTPEEMVIVSRIQINGGVMHRNQLIASVIRVNIITDSENARNIRREYQRRS